MSAPDISLEELKQRLRPGQRLLGLDIGSKTIGIAISDLSFSIATGRHTIKRTKFQKDAAEIIALCEEENVGGLIIGLPLNMDGSEGPRVQSTRAFVRNMAALTDIPASLWDERLSTAAVTRTLIEADVSRKARSAVVDKLAATYILQGALDRLSTMDG